MKPTATLILCLATILITLFPESIKSLLYFDHAQINVGKIWTLITGHWVHADAQHLLWNILGLGVLGCVIERYSRRLFLLSLCTGMLAVNVLLMSPLCDLLRYCGLSGVLNTLLGVALYCRWAETKSPWIILVGVLSILKTIIELQAGSSIFTDISWPPYPPAHLAGLLATPITLTLYANLWPNSPNRRILGQDAVPTKHLVPPSP